jgi:hypothetical protein
MSDEERLANLLTFIRSDGRCSPMGRDWHRLWQMLPADPNGERAPRPLILAAAYSPGLWKMERLEEHVRWAATYGGLAEVDRYLRGLPREAWDPPPSLFWSL